MEPPVSDGQQKRRADYAFRGVAAFAFLAEAKRAQHSIEDPNFIYQAKHYAWCAKCPVVVLTNFRQFNVYLIDSIPDATRPECGLQAHLSGTLETWTTFWPEFSSVFSRSAVQLGSLEKMRAKSVVDIRSRQAVDQAFLKHLMAVRRQVGKAILAASPSLADEDLDFQTQVLIDRLVFLRVAEDRGITLVPGSSLREVSLTENGTSGRLARAFREMKTRYNGDLFQRQQIDNIAFPDASLLSIVSEFVPPRLSYRLDAFPSDFLGTIYERYIGVMLTSDSSGQVRYRSCPERIRAQGAHYTPRTVVDYMVAKSIGYWLWFGPPPTIEERIDSESMAARRWRSLEALETFRILDPSCGSGAFLLSAFDCILDWYLERLRARPSDVSKREYNRLVVSTTGGGLYARPALKAQIARQNLFGIDVDSRAIEVARMSLYLRIMEDNQTLFPEMHLPDLSKNLRCGNTLVHPDWIDIDSSTATYAQINPWAPDGPGGFPEILRAGGFDVVIGNPPYVFGEFLSDKESPIYRERYALGAEGQIDLFKLFFERTIRALLRESGTHCFIVPDSLLARDEHCVTRRWIRNNLSISNLCHIGPVFTSLDMSPAGEPETPRPVGVSSVVLVGDKFKQTKTRPLPAVCRWTDGRSDDSYNIPWGALPTDGGPWLIAAPSEWYGPRGFRAALEAHQVLGSLLLAGPHGATRGEELGKSSLSDAQSPLPTSYTHIYAGEDILRHAAKAPRKQVEISRIEKASAYYVGPKILFVKTGAGPVSAVANDSVPVLQSVYTLHLDPVRAAGWDEFTLTAVINSALVTAYAYYMWTYGKLQQPQFTLLNVRALPIPTNPPKVLSDLARRLETLVKTSHSVGAPGRVQAHSAQIARVEHEIDEQVAKAFGLSLKDWESFFRPAFAQLPESQRPRWWI